MVDSDRFIKNWPSTGGFWEKFLKGSRVPSINAKRLVQAIGGSSVMLLLYTLLAYFRNAADAFASAVAGLFEFASDLVGVLYGTGATVTAPGETLDSIPGPRDYFGRVYAETAQSLQSDPALAFLAAFLLVLTLATVALVVRRYAI